MKKESYTKEEIYDKINEVFDMVYDGSYILPEIKKY